MRLALMSFVAVAGLAACSGGSGGGGPVSDPPTTPISPSPSPSITSVPSPGLTPSAIGCGPMSTTTTMPGPGSSPTPGAACAMSTQTLPAAGGTLALPNAGGSAGTVTFSANSAPAGTTVTIVHSVEPVHPGYYGSQSLQLQFSADVGFTAFPPGFSIQTQPGYQPLGPDYGESFQDTTSGGFTSSEDAPVCGTDIFVRAGASAFTAVANHTYALALADSGATPAPSAKVTCPPSP